MKLFPTALVALSLSLLGSTSSASEENDLCKSQADVILHRLQSEVVGQLSADQRSAANTIVFEVCQVREQAAEHEMEQAVSKAREEEQEKASNWLTTSADKPGNDRLKRKSH